MISCKDITIFLLLLTEKDKWMLEDFFKNKIGNISVNTMTNYLRILLVNILNV